MKLNLYNLRSELGAAALIFTNISTALINLIIIPVTISNVGLSIYGEFILVNSISSAFFIIFSMKSWPSLVRFMNKSEEQFLVNEARLIELKGLLTATLIALLSIFLGSNFYNYSMSIIGVILLILSTGFGCYTVPISVLTSKKKVNYIAIANISAPLIKLFILMLPNASVLYVCMVYFLSELIRIIILIMFEFKVAGKDEIKLSNNKLKELVNSMSWMRKSAIVDLPVQHLDKIIISAFLGVKELAIFFIIKRIASSITLVSEPICQLLYGKISSKKIATKNENLNFFKKQYYHHS